MEKEDIQLNNAADSYVGHSQEIDEDLSVFERRVAFKDGALWWKNNHKLHWYKANQIPEKGLTVLCIYGTGYCDATEIVGATNEELMIARETVATLR